MKVYSNINTLVKVKRLLDEVGLNGVLDGAAQSEKNLNDLLNELLTGGKAIEFLQVITRNNDVDFGEMEPAEIKEIVTNFFTGIKEYLPESLQTRLQNMVTAKGMSS
jgi:hypothetical protein